MTRELQSDRVACRGYRAGFLKSLTSGLAGCAVALTFAGAAHADGENLLFYNAQTGAGAIAKLQGDEVVTVKSYAQGAFSPRWTHVSATSGNTVLFYDAARGSAGEGQLDRGNFVTTKTWPDRSFGKWTSIVAAPLGMRPLFYNAADGSAGIGYSPPGRLYPAGAFSPGWTQIATTNTALLFYNANNGAGGIVIPVSSGAAGQQPSFAFPNDVKTIAAYKPGSFSTGWTHVVATPSGILFYNKFDGSGGIGQIVMGPGANEASFRTVHSYAAGAFSTGWTQIAAAGDKIVFYNASNGAGGVGEIEGSVFKTTKSYAPNSFSVGWTHLVVAADSAVVH